ncbi:MAG: superinfection immunity protein [Proteobacteria bacterium]|nr:superinfection immunity protein [Pseudomonadota bacterium]
MGFGIDSIGGLLLLGLLLWLYFLPWWVAKGRKHPNVYSIDVVNVFLGWTFIGWVACLAWSLSAAGKPQQPG